MDGPFGNTVLQIKDCQDSFVKECYIATEDVVTPVKVTICEDAFTRKCAPTYREEEGEVCSVEYATGQDGHLSLFTVWLPFSRDI